ncbi:hypothetical protein BpHYR1_031525, partial [Brachionus plicatilis]
MKFNDFIRVYCYLKEINNSNRNAEEDKMIYQNSLALITDILYIVKAIHTKNFILTLPYTSKLIDKNIFIPKQ